MKKFVIIILILSFPVFLQAQSCSIRRMFRSYDTGKEITRIHIPSCMTRMGSWFVDDADTKYLLKQVKSIYVMASEDEGFSNNSNFPSEIARNLQKRDFEEMMVVNSEGDKVKILLRESGKKRKEFVISVDGKDDALIYLRTKIDLAELAELGDFGGLGIKGVNIGELTKEL